LVAAPVTLDTVTTNVDDANILTHEHPVDAPNALLLVTVQLIDSNDSCQSVTYAGVPLTLVKAIVYTTDKPRAELWQLFNPPVGSAAVEVTIADGKNAKCAVAAVTFTGVDPTKPVDTCVATSAKSAAGGVIVPSEQGDLVFGAVVSLASGVPSPGTGSVLVWTTEVDGSKYGPH
jgi:hypothetical protein